jgi:uncharacterized membrane protein YedE/YeeE
MMRTLAALLIGAVFGAGIAISGMINPAKVQNFFDFAGTWDPSLAFVMGGALLVTFVGYRLVLKRPAPVFDTSFHLPTKKQIDPRLLAGAATFGVGWGITGFCPGGSIPALGLAEPSALIFMAAMVVGIALARIAGSWRQASPTVDATTNG